MLTYSMCYCSFKWAKYLNCKNSQYKALSVPKEQELQFYKFTKCTEKCACEIMSCCLCLSDSFTSCTSLDILLFSISWGPITKKLLTYYWQLQYCALPIGRSAVLGNLNTCELSPHLPTLQQYVTTPTRSNHILDRCLSNIVHTRQCADSLLGKSDRNVIHLSQHTD